MATEQTARRRRRDAGQPAVTERDARTLRFAGEQYGIRADTAAVLLARLSPAPRPWGDPAAPAPAASADRTVRMWAERMDRGGYLRRTRVFDQIWFTPTTAGLRLAGLPWGPWAPDAWKLPHVHAVATVRLDLEQSYPGARWISDREIHTHWHGSGARVRIADGGLELADGRKVGVEVELKRKQRTRYQGIVRDQDPAWSEVWWYVRREDLAWLRQILADELAAGHVVAELPPGAVA
jgi:hypothetical protein